MSQNTQNNAPAPLNPIQTTALSLQHVVAMVVGCATVPTIVSLAAGITGPDAVIMMQASLFVAAIAIFLQLYNLGGLVGSGLPVIVGSGFAFIATMVSIAANPSLGISYMLGAQLVGAIVAIGVGLAFKHIRFLFAPVVTSSVVITIGISLYRTALGYMAGGTGSADFGSPLNWGVAMFTLIVTLVLGNFGKGVVKTASTLFGLVAGYILAFFMGMISFDSVTSAGWFQAPQPLHFGLDFDAAAIVSLALVFVISAVQDIGQFEATSGGAFNRRATDKEITGGIIGNSLSSLVGAFTGGAPAATAGQNVGIVVSSGVTAKPVFILAGVLVLITSLVPKAAAVFLTIPSAVLGGATVTVFGSIAMTGITILSNAAGLSRRNLTIAGLAIAMAIGLSYFPEPFAGFPAWFQSVFGTSPVLIAALVSIILNLVLPAEPKPAPAEQK
jgi:uracil-xanthine permease